MSQHLQASRPVQPAATGLASIQTDHLMELIEAGLCGDFNLVRRLGKLLVDELPQEDAAAARIRLEEITRRRMAPRQGGPAPVAQRPSPSSAVERAPWPEEPLFLESRVSDTLGRFIEETVAVSKLQEAGLASRSNFLLSGPPGTGKTSIAGHVAARLGRPFNVLRLDAVVSSLFGDTARNLRQAFEAARGRDGFLFLDEIDAIAKARDDARDVGELKRVVNTLIQALDALPADAVVIAATNHPQLLDQAIWRRFPFQAELGLPSTELRRRLWEHHLRLETSARQRGGAAARRGAAALAAISEGLSGSDIREIARSARRLALLDGAALDMASVSDAVLASTGGRLAMPRRMNAVNRATLRDGLAADERLTGTDRAALRGVSQQAESLAKRRHMAVK